MIDYRFGEWQNVLRDDFDALPRCNAVISDPPFGKRTHEGAKRATRSDGASTEGTAPDDYDPWNRDNVFEYTRLWSAVCDGWIATMTSHDLIPDFEDAAKDVGRQCFAPIPIVMPGMSVRLQGDGPSSWSCFLMVSRPKEARFMGGWTRRGAYVGPPNPKARKGRGKPLWLLREIVSDYSHEGDTVIDPMAGWGSTLIASAHLGRHAIGCDGHVKTFNHGSEELAKWMGPL